MAGETMSQFADEFNEFAERVYQNNLNHGFWEKPFNLGEKIALMHSELSEALEADRAGNPMDEKVRGRTNLAVELADCVIRIMDIATYLDLDLGTVIEEKHAFNVKRPYKHGKQY